MRFSEKLKNIQWKRLILFGAVLFLITLIGVAAFLTKDKQNTWLIEKETNPYASPLPNAAPNDWDVILAQKKLQEFSPDQRKAFAINFSKSIETLSEEEGFSPNELRDWFINTALTLEKYPIIFFKFSADDQTPYRDLSNSNFPKASRLRIFYKNIGDKQIIFYSAIVLPFLSFLIFILFMIPKTFASRELSFKYKIFTAFFILMTTGEGYLLYTTTKSHEVAPVSVIGYRYFDGRGKLKNLPDNYVSIQGTWISNTKLASPINKSEVRCLRDKEICISCEADILDGTLINNLDLYDIAKWTDKEITYETQAMCAKIVTTIDREHEKITELNVATNTDGFCKTKEAVPMASYMGDGFQEYWKLRQGN